MDAPEPPHPGQTVAPEGFVMLFRRFEKRWRKRKTYEDVDAMLDVFAWMAAYGPLTRHSNEQIVHLKRGEVLLSSRYCAKRWDWSPSKASRQIRRWQEEGFLRRVRSEGQAGTVYELPNYPPLNVLRSPGGEKEALESVGDPPPEPTGETPPTRRKAKRQKASSRKNKPRAEPPNETDGDPHHDTNKKKKIKRISTKEVTGSEIQGASTSHEPSISPSYHAGSDEFKEFLLRYPPRNVEPNPATVFTAWYAVIASGRVTPSELVEAAKYYYENQREASRLNSQWVQAPQTFLKTGAWEEVLETGRRRPPRSVLDPYDGALRALRRHEEQG